MIKGREKHFEAMMLLFGMGEILNYSLSTRNTYTLNTKTSKN